MSRQDLKDRLEELVRLGRSIQMQSEDYLDLRESAKEEVKVAIEKLLVDLGFPK